MNYVLMFIGLFLITASVGAYRHSLIALLLGKYEEHKSLVGLSMSLFLFGVLCIAFSYHNVAIATSVSVN